MDRRTLGIGEMAAISQQADERDWRWCSASTPSALIEWAHLLSQEIAEMSVESELGPRFSAEWTRYGLGPIELNFLKCAPQSVRRSPEMASRSLTPYFELLFARQGRIRYSDGKRSSIIPQGAFLIIDDMLGYDLEFPDGSDCLTVRMSGDWLHPWVASPTRFVGTTLGLGQPWARPLAGMLTAIADDGLSKASLSRDVIADQIGAMSSLLTASTATLPSRQRSSLATRISDIVRNRHTEIDLSPSDVSREIGIGIRHLHRTLARTGKTFGSILNEQRLASAEALLNNGGPSPQSIGEVAWAVGFSDQSHFSRVFKAKYGMTPRSYRAGKVC